MNFKSLFAVLILGSLFTGEAFASRHAQRCDAVLNFERSAYAIPHRKIGSKYAFDILNDKSSLAVLDYSQLEEKDLIFKRAVQMYESDFQKAIYQKRLEKFKKTLTTKQQLELARQEDELRQRSYFVLNTKRPLSREIPEFLGGARVVVSYGLSEALPFEMDLKIKRPYTGKASAEVGRLTKADGVAESGPLDRTVEIILTALRTLSDNPDVQFVYVHTSRLHLKLYSMMGLRPFKVIHIDNLNQVLVYNRKQLFEYIRPGALRQVGVDNSL